MSREGGAEAKPPTTKSNKGFGAGKSKDRRKVSNGEDDGYIAAVVSNNSRGQVKSGNGSGDTIYQRYWR